MRSWSPLFCMADCISAICCCIAGSFMASCNAGHLGSHLHVLHPCVWCYTCHSISTGPLMYFIQRDDCQYAVLARQYRPPCLWIFHSSLHSLLHFCSLLWGWLCSPSQNRPSCGSSFPKGGRSLNMGCKCSAMHRRCLAVQHVAK